MTSVKHERASDRVSEAMINIESELNSKIETVVMLQGDEPMVLPSMIDCAVNSFLMASGTKVLNLMSQISTQEEFENPSIIKVVVNLKNEALYFSRMPIPMRAHGAVSSEMFKQVCIIPFERNFLIKFNSLEQTPLEIAESIDMMRVLENGDKVFMQEVDDETYSVDTPVDLEKVQHLMRNDPLINKYIP